MLLIYKNILTLLIFCIKIPIPTAIQDQTSTRANTLLDDADDIQRQLDNEARDRMLKPTTVWVFRLPTQTPELKMAVIKKRLLKMLSSDPLQFYFYIRFPKRCSLDRIFDTSQLPCYSAADQPDLVPERLLRVLRKKMPTDSSRRRADRASDSVGNFKFDQMKWYLDFPECGGHLQSPIDIPNGLIKTKAGRKMIFANYNKRPEAFYMSNDGNRLRLFGDWSRKDRPMIYGGGAHNRRYVFHSITLHWPSEHSVGGLQYPLESQVLHVSADYDTFDDAINVSRKDRLAFLGIVNLYMYRNYSHCSVGSILNNAKSGLNSTITSQPLSHFNPPLKYYASYHGSLTVPPCTEAVLWLIRDQTLPITREAAKAFKSLLIEDFQGSLRREIQPLNDRRIYLFK
ncbi:carbonic anhydrase 6-like [Pieris rapae]|uniref:carbonic anhydrase 6-like n=1 Tax=Pieris rapae TaxID=64459 RepID=UPI001E27D6D7|nr:carbonic anhydrase 6-like [Pieris rapae]